LTPADIGCAPSCPVGSACTGWPDNDFGFMRDGFRRGGRFERDRGLGWGWDGFGRDWRFERWRGRRDGCGERECCCKGNWLGSITVIPVDRIACFTHNSI